MQIAKYNDCRYEIRQEQNNEMILLLSNTWQQGFDVEKIDDKEYYAKRVPINDIQSMWETSISMSATRDGEKTRVDLSDTPLGYMVEFLNTEIPSDILTVLNKHIPAENEKLIVFDTLQKELPDASFWKIKKDLYDSSINCSPVSITEAVASCVKMTKISADKEIAWCPKCNFRFPLENSTVPFGEVYSTECPVCGKTISKKRN